MAELKILNDRKGKTLTVWFTDPSREHICEETGAEVVLMKDAAGQVTGFEKLNFAIPESDFLRVVFETATTSKLPARNTPSTTSVSRRTRGSGSSRR